jgi:hypothetical protein
MKIIIDNNTSDSRQFAIVEIDTKHCNYPYAIREALELALKLDRYSQETISAVFNKEFEDDKKMAEPDPNINEKSFFQSTGTSNLIDRTITATNGGNNE